MAGENDPYTGGGVDWSSVPVPNRGSAPTAASKALAPGQSAGQVGGNFLGRSLSDLIGVGKGLVALPFRLGGDVVKGATSGGDFSQLGSDVSNMGKGIVSEYSDLIHHPAEHFIQHPLNTFLDILPGLGVLGKLGIAGKAGLAGEAGEAGLAAEAGTVGEVGTTGEAATTGGRAIPAQQNLATRLRTGVGGIAPENLPGNAGFNLADSNRLMSLENDLGIHGSAAVKTQQIGQKLIEHINDVNKAVSADPGFPFNTRPLITDLRNSLTDTQSTSKAASFYQIMQDTPEEAQMDRVMNKVGDMIDAKGGHEGNLSVADVHDLRQTLRGFVDQKVWKGVGDPTPADLAYMQAYTELGQKIGEVNPALRDMISKEHDMISLGQQYGQEAAKGGFMRGRTRIAGVSVPVNIGGPIQSITDALGSVGQKITGGVEPYLPKTAGAESVAGAGGGGGSIGVLSNLAGGVGAVNRLAGGGNALLGASRIATEGVIGDERQKENQQARGLAQAQATPVNLTEPSGNIKQLLTQAKGDPRDNPTGYSVEDLQGMIAQDMANGGKHYTELNHLLTIANSATKGRQLTGGAVSKLTAYNGALTALGQMNAAFQSGKDAGNVVHQELPTIAKFFGLSATNKADIAQLQSMLPSASDDPFTAQQKLQAIKQQIDARAEADVSTEQSKNNSMDALLGSLSGAGATP